MRPNNDSILRGEVAHDMLVVARNLRLTPSCVRRMNDGEMRATFCCIRWPATEGKPICPECAGLDIYRLVSRGVFKCKRPGCYKQFSMTSGTAFHARKLPLRECLEAIATFAMPPASPEKEAEGLRVTYKTAHSLADRLIGGGAASYRGVLRLMTGRPAKAEWIARPPTDGDIGQIIAAIDRAVPNCLPEHVRSDICQDMVVAVLAGETKVDRIAQDVGLFIRAHRKMYQEFKHLSLEYRMLGDGAGTARQRLMDVLPSTRLHF